MKINCKFNDILMLAKNGIDWNLIYIPFKLIS